MSEKLINPLKTLSLYRFENFFNVFYDEDAKINFYNLLKNITIYPAEDNTVDLEYIFKENDTWPYISYKFYNTPDLWWLICEYNRIYNPLEQPENGTKLKILKSDYVYKVLEELKLQLNR
jgi:nucleoid-associated protein YgaU